VYFLDDGILDHCSSLLAEIEEYCDDDAVLATAMTNRSRVANTPGLKVFISHRSSDALLAKAIADLLRDAMCLSVSEIRCTSIDGYRLQGGADTATQLRAEVLGATAFVGLITPRTMESPYVLFELGARWGVAKHLCPVLARGADDKSLGGPLGDKNALHLTARAEVVQMIEEIAATLERPHEPLSAFQHEIDEVVRLASDLASTTATSNEEGSDDEVALDNREIGILVFLASKRGSGASGTEIARELELGLERARYHVRRLETLNLVHVTKRDLLTRERWYSLDQAGRGFLIKRDLL
jgi:DNA-binding MarR family transcriptional regulator